MHNVLMAVRWVADAWALMTGEIIQKCFRKSGILTSSMAVVATRLEGVNDPLYKCDLLQEMECLFQVTMTAEGRCTLKEQLE